MIIGFGVGIASQGDFRVNFLGVAIQLVAVVCDAVRCTLLQVTMQGAGLKLSPAETLLHVAPRAAIIVAVPAACLEGKRLHTTPQLPYGWLVLSGVLSSSLNLVAFTLISSTSALTTSVTGPLKEWVCIIASMVAYGDSITLHQFAGYSIAVLGIVWYQYDKVFKGSVLSDHPEFDG